jgi:hypothetical protein
MSYIESRIQQLNADIIAARNSHYDASPTGLIIKTESPNGNKIYHLYEDGEITFQKGGSVYLKRSEFTSKGPIHYATLLNIKFPDKADSGMTYVVLTEEECETFRKLIEELASELPAESNRHVR